MSNEYDYNPNRPENSVPEHDGSTPQTPDGAYTAGNEQTSGAYRYSRESMPGGSYGENAASEHSYEESHAAPGGYEETGYGGNTAQGGYESSYGGNSAYGYGYPPQNPGVNQTPVQNPNPNPMAYYNVTPRQEPKKSGGKWVAAIAVVCALVIGLGGGTALGLFVRGGSSTEQESKTLRTEPVVQEQKVPAEESTAEEPVADAFNSTVIDVTTNSETTNMTPQDVYEHYVNAVVAISNESTATNIYGQYTTRASSGSGFIISKDGYIVTNNHVVSGAENLKVIMTNGEEYEAKIIGADSENDVALIKIEGEDLPTVSVGDSDDIQVGQQVCAIGNPLGELTNTMTVGYVSALDREINENGIPINMFQTDCAINSGNSGGPIFDMHGNVVGITTAKYSSSGSMFSSSSASIEGIGFCIPANDAMDIVSDLLQYGYVKGRPALGISCQAISSTVTQYYKLPAGIYVYEVNPGSAAEKAGLQEGDIINAVDGTEVSSITEFKALLKEYAAGDTVKLKVYRGSTSESMEVEVTFDEMNTSAQTQQNTPENG